MQGKHIILKHWSPRVLFHSLRHNIKAWIGINSNSQITVNDLVVTNIRTIKISIGAPGVAGCDFNFASAENVTKQNLDLGAIVPADARVLEMRVKNNGTFTGLLTLALTIGNVSNGSQFLASIQCFTLGVIVSSIISLLIAPIANSAATKVWLGGTPGANWDLATAGRLDLYITYIELTETVKP